MKLFSNYILVALGALFLAGSISAQQCGRDAGNALCRDRLCCSQFGFCGSTSEYCGTGCQSQCDGPGAPSNPTPAPTSGGVGGIVTRQLFDEMLKHRNNAACPGRNFYTHDAFLRAAAMFPGFGTDGDDATRRREIAAFFGQTSHETTGGWPTAPDGPFAWGYCHVRELDQQTYCDPGRGPCAPGQKYYGRGPIQLTHNYNYNFAGQQLRLDLLNNPDQVATDAVTAFRTAIWFWMTAQANKPSCHNVIVGRWTPSGADNAARRVPGFGVITNIINGGLECNRGSDPRVNSRIGFYQRYCGLLRVGTGANLDCNNQVPFG